MPVTENSSLLFDCCRLKLVVLKNNRLLEENSRLFVKITTQNFPIAAGHFPKYQALDD